MFPLTIAICLALPIKANNCIQYKLLSNKIDICDVNHEFQIEDIDKWNKKLYTRRELKNKLGC